MEAGLLHQAVRPRLTLFNGISIIMGLMVGSGIFSTAGEIQKSVGSPGLSLVLWATTGVLALTGALCYAELGTMIPGSGGEAQYLARGFGPLMVFLFNWTSIMILKPGTVAILSVATASYFSSMVFNMGWGAEGEAVVGRGYLSLLNKALAVLCCITVTLASSLSTNWSNRIQGVLTLGKIGALALVIGSGIYFAVFRDALVVRANLGAPFEGSFFNFADFATALNNGLWAFEGWNNLNIVAGDLANPAVNLPLSIWSSMTAVVTLYLLTLLGYYAVLPAAAIASTQTVGIDFGTVVYGRVGAALMPVLIMSSTFGAALSSMVTSSEIVILAARSGQMPRYFEKLSPTLGTAVRAYWLQGMLASGLVLLSDFKELIMIYTSPTWIFYAACVLVLLKLRYTEPAAPRPYKVWITTPLLFLAACCWLLATSFYADWWAVGLSFVVVLLGIPLYYLFRRFFGKPAEQGPAAMSQIYKHPE